MRNHHVCPKCSCPNLLVIAKRGQPDGRSVNQVYTERVHSGADPSRAFQRIDIGHVEQWICSACGYMESYGRDFAKLAELATKGNAGVFWVQGGGGAGSP